MDRKAFLKSFLPFAFPIVLQYVFNAAIGVSDSLMVGVLGQADLSATTLANQVSVLFNAFILSLCVGSTALIAQYFGNKDMPAVRRVLTLTLQFSLIGGLLFFLSTLLAPSVIMGLFTNDRELIAAGTPYLRVTALSFLLMSFSQIYLNLMKNTGSAKQSSNIGSVTVVLNIVMNYVFIYGKFGMPQMGITGAALSTIIARSVEFFLTLAASLRSERFRVSFIELFRFQRAMLKKFMRFTSTSFVQTMAWNLATTVTISIVAHQNSDLVAASSIVIIVVNILSGVYYGFSNAAGISVGQMLGRGELKQARSAGDILLAAAVVMGALLGGIVLLLRPVLCAVCTQLTPIATGYLGQMLILLFFRCIGKGFATIISKGLFTAGGDLLYLTKLDIVNMWGVVIPLGLLAAYVFHLPPMVVYTVVNLDEWYKMFFMWKRYRKYVWVKNLTRKEWAEPVRHENAVRRKIIAEMPMGVLLIGGAGRISMVNPACARLLGTTLETLEGQHYADLFMSHPDNEVFSDYILSALSTKEKPQDFVAVYHAKGVSIPLAVHAVFMEDEDEKLGICLMLQKADESQLPSA